MVKIPSFQCKGHGFDLIRELRFHMPQDEGKLFFFFKECTRKQNLKNGYNNNIYLPKKGIYVYVYVWLIDSAAQQKLTQHCEATICQ